MTCKFIVKILLVLFNIMIFIAGTLLLAIGFVVEINTKEVLGVLDNIKDIPPELIHLVSAGYLMITIGAILVFMGFLGCCGACCGNKCVLMTFFIIILIVFVTEVVTAILILLYQPTINDWAIFHDIYFLLLLTFQGRTVVKVRNWIIKKPERFSYQRQVEISFPFLNEKEELTATYSDMHNGKNVLKEYTRSTKVKKKVEKRLDKFRQNVAKSIKANYGQNDITTNAWNETMSLMKCCGYSNYTDFTGSSFVNRTQQYPQFCCPKKPKECGIREAASERVDGCFDAALKLVMNDSTLLGSVAICVVAIEVAVMVMSLILYKT